MKINTIWPFGLNGRTATGIEKTQTDERFEIAGVSRDVMCWEIEAAVTERGLLNGMVHQTRCTRAQTQRRVGGAAGGWAKRNRH